MKTRVALALAAAFVLTSAAFAASPAPSPSSEKAFGTAVAEKLRGPADEGRAIDDNDRTGGRVPKVPFIFDGVEFPAGTKLPSYELTFVLTPEDIGNGTIHIFTSRDVAKVFMERNLPKNTPDASGHRAKALDTCSWTQEYSWFNTAVGCGNSGVLTLYPFASYSNLDFGGWNNTISCVKAACIGYYTVIYSCRNFQMTSDSSCADPAALYIPSGFIITDLNQYGFNNRTSSIDFE
jgi:hypothetical protein